MDRKDDPVARTIAAALSRRVRKKKVPPLPVGKNRKAPSPPVENNKTAFLPTAKEMKRTALLPTAEDKNNTAASPTVEEKKKGIQNFRVMKSIEDMLGLNLTSGHARGIIKLLLKETLRFQQLQISEEDKQNDKSDYELFMEAHKLTSSVSFCADNTSLNYSPLIKAINDQDAAKQLKAQQCHAKQEGKLKKLMAKVQALRKRKLCEDDFTAKDLKIRIQYKK